MRRRRVPMVLGLLVLLLAFAVVFNAAGASASSILDDNPSPVPAEPTDPDTAVPPVQGGSGFAPVDVQNPFTTVCAQPAPTPSSPYADTAGLFLPDPLPQMEGSMLASTGYGGFSSWTYDLGCSFDRIDYGATNRVPNALSSTAVAITSITDSVHRQAWSPAWISVTLEGFADEVTDTLDDRAWVTILGIGLFIATALLLRASGQGAVSTVANGAVWAGVVVVLVGILLVAPLSVAVWAQSLQGQVVAQLYGSDGDPATAQTEQTLRTVHYLSWERRAFGNDPSPVVLEQAPKVWDATTYTFAENRAQNASGEAAKKLRAEHAEAFTTAYDAVCERSVQACEAMQGRNNKTSIAALELGFSLAANGFRFMAAVLLVICTVLIVLYGLVWLVVSPYLVTMAGAGLRLLLLNNTWIAITTALLAALGSWGFGLWAQMAMSPDLSTGFSLVLLAVGTVLFWGLLRPDRKLLSLATGGKVRGYGRLVKFAVGLAGTFVAARTGAAAGVRAAASPGVDDEPDAEVPDGRYRASYPVPARPAPASAPREPLALGPAPVEPLEGTVHRPDPAGAVSGDSVPREPRVVIGEVVPDPFVQGIDSSQVYQRGESEPVEFPAPPAPTVGTAAAVEVYRRPTADAPAPTSSTDEGVRA